MKTKLNTLIFTICAYIFLLTNSSNSQNFEWADNNAGSFQSMDVDLNGNTYILGSNIAKYNNSGVLQWEQGIGIGPRYYGSNIVCDYSDNFYITGEVLTSDGIYTGISAMFVAKYNSSGVLLWERTMSSTPFNESKGSHIAVDNNGDCFVAGIFSGNVIIGGYPVSSIGNPWNMFLAKFSAANGVCSWTKSGGGNIGFQICHGLIIDPLSNNVFISGDFGGSQSVTFGTVVINDISGGFFGTSGFIVKYDNSGQSLSGQVFQADDDYIGGVNRRLGIDANSNIYILANESLLKCNTSLSQQPQTISSWVNTSGDANTHMTSLKTDENGNCYMVGDFYGTIKFPPLSITSYYDNSTNIVVAKIDSYGNILWVNNAGGILDIVNSNDITADQQGNAYITGQFNGSLNFGTINLNFPNPNLEESSTFISKISANSNASTGFVFIDNNCDNFQSSDPVFPNVIVSASGASGQSFASSGPSGKYFVYYGTGLQTLSIPNLPLYYQPKLPLITKNFSVLGNYSFNDHLGLCPVPNKNDLRINITEVMRARPGFKTAHRLTYKNVGTTTLSGTITLTYDNHLLNPVCTPSASSISGNVITWVLSNPLQPNQEGSIDIIYEVPNDVTLLNTTLISNAAIASGQTDETPGDNEADLGQIVVGSYDPNDKSVEPADNISPQNILNGDYLTYTIRFQNTGTYLAEKVVITDLISDKLNISSIETISASHDFKFSITENNILNWTFNNISLPDATSNEVKSHGYVKFRIKPKNNLVVGDEITNSANIYFDFNEPVITNATTTTIVETSPCFISLAEEGLYDNGKLSMRDTVTAYLRNETSPYAIVDSAKGVIDSLTFTGNFIFTNFATGTYYIQVKHRNSIETWSKTGVPMTVGSVNSYDFTTSATQAFGDNMKLKGSKYCIYSGDVDQDGIVDLSDLNAIYNASKIFATGYLSTDLTGDGVVDLSDLNIAYNNSNGFVTVIRP